MKNIYLLIAILCIAGCGNRTTTTVIQYDQLASYEDIDKAIDHIVEPGNWNEDDCTTIDARINACEMYSLIDSTQTNALKEKLNSYSNKYLYDGVDSLFRCPSYKGLTFWRDMLSYMQKQYDYYIQQQVSLASSNMKKAKIIIDDYDKVCQWAQASGYAKPKFLEKYPINIASEVNYYKNKIQNEPNYKNYFKVNTDLKRTMDGMKARMEASRVKYYDGLEDLVEDHILKNELTEEEVLDLQLKFNALESSSSTHSQKAIDKLSKFVTDYITALIEKENEAASANI